MRLDKLFRNIFWDNVNSLFISLSFSQREYSNQNAYLMAAFGRATWIDFVIFETLLTLYTAVLKNCLLAIGAGLNIAPGSFIYWLNLPIYLKEAGFGPLKSYERARWDPPLPIPTERIPVLATTVVAIIGIITLDPKVYNYCYYYSLRLSYGSFYKLAFTFSPILAIITSVLSRSLEKWRFKTLIGCFWTLYYWPSYPAFPGSYYWGTPPPYWPFPTSLGFSGIGTRTGCRCLWPPPLSSPSMPSRMSSTTGGFAGHYGPSLPETAPFCGELPIYVI